MNGRLLLYFSTGYQNRKLHHYDPIRPVLNDASAGKNLADRKSGVGVPLNRVFEHLDATITAATPLYELCANLLRVDSAVS